MAWKFVGFEKGFEPLPGIPLECTDEEFESAVAAYEARFGKDAKGSVVKSGLYEKVKARSEQGAVRREES